MQGSDWSDFQAFLAVARAGQLRRAAAAAGVDATTLSRRVRRLETRLGRTLFEQTRQGHVLTVAGEAALAEVEAMEAATLRLEAQERAAGQVSGLLRVSVSEGFGTWFVARHLPDFAARYPDLLIDLVASSGFLSPSKREADLAITLSRPRAGPVIAGKLTGYGLKLYAAKRYLAAHADIASAADLREGHRLVGYVPDLVYAPELRYLEEIGPGLSADLRSSSINAQHALIASGAGLGVLPCFIGEADPALVPVLPAKMIERAFWIVTHKDTHALARIRAFKTWIADLVAGQRALLLPRGG
jgi:DNA-binding transcriptional LysR family regulator